MMAQALRKRAETQMKLADAIEVAHGYGEETSGWVVEGWQFGRWYGDRHASRKSDH